jgi:hypothetical protein
MEFHRAGPIRSIPVYVVVVDDDDKNLFSVSEMKNTHNRIQTVL